MNKKVKHMSMNLTEEEHEKWHEGHPELAPEQLEAFMKKMDVRKQDEV